MDIMLNNILPKMGDHYNPILICITFKKAFYKRVTSTIQFWMDIMLNNILLKWFTSTIQFWMDIMLNNILPKMNNQYNPILDGYCAK